MSELPEKWVPSALRPSEPPERSEPMFAIGVETAAHEYGMTHGPFQDLEQALEVVPEACAIAAGPVRILRFDESGRHHPLYEWRDSPESSFWHRISGPSP